MKVQDFWNPGRAARWAWLCRVHMLLFNFCVWRLNSDRLRLFEREVGCCPKAPPRHSSPTRQAWLGEKLAESISPPRGEQLCANFLSAQPPGLKGCTGSNGSERSRSDSDSPGHFQDGRPGTSPAFSTLAFVQASHEASWLKFTGCKHDSSHELS